MSAHSVPHSALGVRRRRRAAPRIAAGLMLALAAAAPLCAGCGGGGGSGPPAIENVSIVGTPGAYTLTVTGSGFGSPGAQVSLPYIGVLPNFRILDVAQVGHGEWGYSGDANVLTYSSWFDTQIQVSGFGGGPGDAVIIGVWNSNSEEGAVWGGNVPPTSSEIPTITAVQFSGSDENLQITVLGSGFGSAPVAMPYTGDLNQFFFEDDRAPCGGSALFNAGWTFWGATSPGAVTLVYESWSDTQIRIGGFAGQYGQGCAAVAPGDPVAIAVFNSAATGPNGMQTAWGGAIPTTR